MKFAGRDGVVYTPAGKGGLVREMLLPHRLAERLEDRRLDAPAPVADRGVRYLQRYDDVGGNAFSTSSSRASIEACRQDPAGRTACAVATPRSDHLGIAGGGSSPDVLAGRVPPRHGKSTSSAT